MHTVQIAGNTQLMFLFSYQKERLSHLNDKIKEDQN